MCHHRMKLPNCHCHTWRLCAHACGQDAPPSPPLLCHAALLAPPIQDCKAEGYRVAELKDGQRPVRWELADGHALQIEVRACV